VIERLGAEGAQFTPFSAASLTGYAAAVGETVGTTSAQAAIKALRQKKPLPALGAGAIRHGGSGDSRSVAVAGRFAGQLIVPAPSLGALLFPLPEKIFHFKPPPPG
jgi:hypothetical protein